MKAGFYSPLPPARSGVADYSAALLVERRRSRQAEVADRAAWPDFRLRALAVTRGRKRREP